MGVVFGLLLEVYIYKQKGSGGRNTCVKIEDYIIS